MPARAFLTIKSERTFLSVLQCATDLFRSKGFDKTSMRDISRESGVALGTLYYYCRSKEELVLLFYERVSDQIQQAYEAQSSGTRSLGDAFVEFLELKMTRLTRSRKLLAVVLRESFDPDSVLSPLNDSAKQVRKKSVEVFRTMALTHGVVKSDVDDTAKLLWLLHIALLAFWLYDRSEKYASTARLLRTVSALISWSAALKHVPGFSALYSQLRGALLGLAS